MNKFLLTAAALTLGTSAWAGTPAKDPTAMSGAGAKTLASIYAAPALKTDSVKDWAFDTAGYAMAKSASDGMGGPLEPATDAPKQMGAEVDHSAMGHDAKVEKVEAPMTEAEAEAAIAAKASATPPAPGAIGGPVETRTGYPACSAAITDSCIQLYERGVTGSGN